MAVVNVCPLCGSPPKSYSDKGHFYVECERCTEGREVEGFWVTHELYDFLTRPGHPFQSIRRRLAGLLDRDIGTTRMRPIATRHAEELMGGA